MSSLLDLPVELLDCIIDDYLQPDLKQLTQIAVICRGFYAYLLPRLARHLAFTDREDSIRTAYQKAEQSGHLVKALHFTTFPCSNKSWIIPGRYPSTLDSKTELGKMVRELLSGRLTPCLKTVTLRIAIDETTHHRAADETCAQPSTGTWHAQEAVKVVPAHLSLFRNMTVRRLVLVNAIGMLGFRLSPSHRQSRRTLKRRHVFFSRLESLRIASVDGHACSSDVCMVSAATMTRPRVIGHDFSYIPAVPACITDLEIAAQGDYHDFDLRLGERISAASIWNSSRSCDDPFPNLERLRLDHVEIVQPLAEFLCERASVTLKTLEMWDCWVEINDGLCTWSSPQKFTWSELFSTLAAARPVLERLIIHPDGLSYYLPEAFAYQSSLPCHTLATWSEFELCKERWDAAGRHTRETRGCLGVCRAFSYAENYSAYSMVDDWPWRLTERTLDRMEGGEDMQAYRALTDIVHRNAAKRNGGNRLEEPSGPTWDEADYEAWFRKSLESMERRKKRDWAALLRWENGERR